MTVDELLVFANSYIHKDHARILLAELIGKNPLELLSYLDEQVPIDKAELFKKAVIALKEGKPLQYIMQHINFYGLDFYIDERVLIPRFETEELVENTIKYIERNFKEPIDIIDLGCGSGVIGLTLEKKLSSRTLDLVDISKEALDVTKINCEKLNSKANLIESDFFEKVSNKYDLIISNPPYIMNNEEIEQIVKDNEPHLALYAGDDGLDSYRKILSSIKNHMKDKCLIAFEIGYKQKESLIKLINENLEDIKIEVKKDLSGKDRMLFILKNIE